MEEEVLFSIGSDHIARLTLNRPAEHNALNSTMIQKLIDHFQGLQDTPSVRALVIQARGDNFCTGADLFWMKQMSATTMAENFEDAQKLSLVMNLLDTLPMPTLAYAHGLVMGGGLGLLSCCDIVLADSQSLFSFSEVKLGIVPAAISPFILRAIGPRYSRRYFLTGEKFDTSIAYHIGLIHQIVDLEWANTEIDLILNHIFAGGPRAVRRAKKLIRDISGDVPEDVRRTTAELLADIRISEEGQEGLSSFLNKKNPAWVRK